MKNEIQEALSVLELKSDVKWDDIQKTYKELIKIWHPDRFNHDEKLRLRAIEKTKTINHAVVILKPHYKKNIISSSFKVIKSAVTSGSYKVQQEKKARRRKLQDSSSYRKHTMRTLRRKRRRDAKITRAFTGIAVFAVMLIIFSVGYPSNTKARKEKQINIQIPLKLDSNNNESQQSVIIIKNKNDKVKIKNKFTHLSKN